MPDDKDQLEANKELVLRYMRLAQQGEREQCLQILAEDAVRIFPRPGERPDPVTRGNVNIVGDRPHTTLYKPGSMQMEVENVTAEGPRVAVQFIIRATAANGAPYENFYHHLYEVHGGRITRYWEYCDTLYGAKVLRPESLGGTA